MISITIGGVLNTIIIDCESLADDETFHTIKVIKLAKIKSFLYQIQDKEKRIFHDLLTVFH